MAADEQADFEGRLKVVLTMAQQNNTFVPLGVPDINQKAENDFFTFHYTLTGPAIDSLLFEIIDSTGQTIHSYLSSPPDQSAGNHLFNWDGFDHNDIYDSSRFDRKSFQLKITAAKAGAFKTFLLSFSTRYKVVDWLDIRIDRRVKEITATLRTNFKDGGCNKLVASGRSRSFNELLSLATAGLQYHWGRNSRQAFAKNIQIGNGDTYDFYLNVDNSGCHAIKSPKIVYQTNARSRRSRNWELSRILFYNTGHLLHSGRWYEKAPEKADAEFKLIAAHEIGHEILLAFGGHLYSKTHKSSSTLLSQRPLGNFIYPGKGEIDLMIYYAEDEHHPCPQDYIARSVASEADVMGLIWLSKLQIVQ